MNAAGVGELSCAAWPPNGSDSGCVTASNAVSSSVALFAVGNSWVAGIGTSPGTGDILSIESGGTNVPFVVLYDRSGGSSIFRFELSPPPDSLVETYTLNWQDYSTNLQL